MKSFIGLFQGVLLQIPEHIIYRTGFSYYFVKVITSHAKHIHYLQFLNGEEYCEKIYTTILEVACQILVDIQSVKYK